MTSRLKSAASERSGKSATAKRIAATKILRVDLRMVKSPSGNYPFSARSANAACVSKTRLGFAIPTRGRRAKRVKLCRKAEYISRAQAAERAEGMMDAE